MRGGNTGIAVVLWREASRSEKAGHIPKAVSCLEAICQSSTSFMPVVEMHTRLWLGRMLLEHTSNVAEAKGHLERAVLGHVALKCRVLSLLSKCYALLGHKQFQKLVLARGLDLAQSHLAPQTPSQHIAPGDAAAVQWFCCLALDLAALLVAEGRGPEALALLAKAQAQAELHPALAPMQVLLAASSLHARLLLWRKRFSIEKALAACDRAWGRLSEDQAASSQGLFVYLEMLRCTWSMRICDNAGALEKSTSIDKALAALTAPADPRSKAGLAHAAQVPAALANPDANPSARPIGSGEGQHHPPAPQSGQAQDRMRPVHGQHHPQTQAVLQGTGLPQHTEASPPLQQHRDSLGPAAAPLHGQGQQLGGTGQGAMERQDAGSRQGSFVAAAGVLMSHGAGAMTPQLARSGGNAGIQQQTLPPMQSGQAHRPHSAQQMLSTWQPSGSDESLSHEQDRAPVQLVSQPGSMPQVAPAHPGLQAPLLSQQDRSAAAGGQMGFASMISLLRQEILGSPAPQQSLEREPPSQEPAHAGAGVQRQQQESREGGGAEPWIDGAHFDPRIGAFWDGAPIQSPRTRTLAEVYCNQSSPAAPGRARNVRLAAPERQGAPLPCSPNGVPRDVQPQQGAPGPLISGHSGLGPMGLKAVGMGVLVGFSETGGALRVDWLPLAMLQCLADIVAISYLRPTGSFKECLERVHGCRERCGAELARLGISMASKEANLQPWAAIAAGTFVQMLVLAEEHEAIIALTTSDLPAAQKILMELTHWLARFPCGLALFAPNAHSLLGLYCCATGAFKLGATHFQLAVPRVPGVPLGPASTLALSSAVLALLCCAGDPLAQSQAVDLMQGLIHQIEHQAARNAAQGHQPGVEDWEEETEEGMRSKCARRISEALLLLRQGNAVDARLCLAAGLKDTYRRLGNRQLAAQYLLAIASINLLSGDVGAAKDAVKSGLRLTERVHDKLLAMAYSAALAEVHARQGKAEEAAQCMASQEGKQSQLNKVVVATTLSPAHALLVQFGVLPREP